ncbi:MAG: hypothetical protein CK548_03060 [Opitutia bacterium]|nr:MAG: hypothetical protein CK548_03060 [Opitutae bacterium]
MAAPINSVVKWHLHGWLIYADPRQLPLPTSRGLHSAASAFPFPPLPSPTMNVENPPAAPAAKPKKVVSANPADRYSNAGNTLDPWDQCARLEYGADRSFAWSVREQVIATPPDGRGRIEEKLLSALAASGRTDAGLAFVCQMLAMVASSKSVPALAPLLRDAKTADSARYALERIAGPEADAAFRDALPALTGNLKAGLIGSIGVRGDAAAKSALTVVKDDAKEPAVVREAAAHALDRLATAKA